MKNETSGGVKVKTALRVALVPAGETDFVRNGRFEGDVDVPLTRRGRCASRQIAGDLLLPLGGVHGVYSAENQGSRETAEILAAANSSRIRLRKDLNGVSYGLWEGQLVAEVRQRHARMFEQWRRDPASITPPGGEEMESAFARVRSALRAIRRKHRIGTVAVVAPSVVISMLYCHLGDFPLSAVFEIGRSMRPVEVVTVPKGR